jgi:hypothetical protein
MQFPTYTRAALAHDLGADLHRWARRVAAVAAVVYVAGMAAGELVHWLNDRLAGGRRPWPVRLGQLLESRPATPLLLVGVSYDGAGRVAGPLKRRPVASAPMEIQSVAQLRQIARGWGIREAGGRPVHLARKADLVAAIRSRYAS